MKAYINIIVWFSFFVVLSLFLGVFIFQIGDEFVMPVMDNVTTQIGDQQNITNEMKTHIGTFPSLYKAIPVPYDLGFIISFLVVFMTSIFTAYKTKEASWFSFFGSITIGFMILLFMTGYMIVLNDWFVLNLIENFLQFDIGEVPIFGFYIHNIGIINLFWFIILLLVNKLNFAIVREEENENNINIPGGSR